MKKKLKVDDVVMIVGAKKYFMFDAGANEKFYGQIGIVDRADDNGDVRVSTANPYNKKFESPSLFFVESELVKL